MADSLSLLTKLRNKVSGLRTNLAFSNRWAILAQRLLRPVDPVVAYHWMGRWWLVCDTRFQDANAPKEVLAEGVYDEAIRRSVRDGELSYVNVGANIGAFDIAVASLAEKIPFACSVELNPRTFSRLNFNLQLNDLQTVKTINAGLGAEAGTFHFRASDCSLADSVFASSAPTDGEANFIKIPIMTLSRALESAGLDEAKFDLLKIDCEGAEYAIIRECSVALLRRFAHLVIELHPAPPGEFPRSLYQKLAEAGFESTEPEWIPSPVTSLRFWTRKS